MEAAIGAPGAPDTSPAVWAELQRAAMQQQLEQVVLRLSQATPLLLDPGGAKFLMVEKTLSLPSGEQFRFVASLELVE